MSAGSRLRAFLELVRPANVVTAFADVLAGFAAAGAMPALLDGRAPSFGADPIYLLLATSGLYAGGVVLNDVFDAPLDAVERPDRPIPSGRVTRLEASVLGFILLAGGVGAAGLVGVVAFVAAGSIAACAILYDAVSKHHAIFGPLNMGACRGGNLLLGVCIAPTMLPELWYLAFLPVAYIGAVTAVSRGEVRGGARSTGVLSVALLAAVTTSILLLGLRIDFQTVQAAPFLAVFAALVFPAFVRAAIHPAPDRVRKAVRVGVLSLVAMDAAIAAGFGGWAVGLAVLALLAVSLGLARLFAVT